MRDSVKGYIACVNNGSGVIFQPKDPAYSYILTVKHIFTNSELSLCDGKVKIDYYNSEYKNHESVTLAELEVNSNYFPHPSKDIAILKISRLPTQNDLIRIDDNLNTNNSFSLFGFPKSRREKLEFIDRIREDSNLSLSIKRSNGKREGVLADNSQYDELLGQSGGGIFSLDNDQIGLVGIQNSVPSNSENKGRIEFSPLDNFDEIIDLSNGLLEPLLPCYMKCFSFLKNEVFKLNVDKFDELKVLTVRNYLQNKAHDVINSGVTPSFIKSYFENGLLINEKDQSVLYKKDIWLVWLEFLVVMNIVKYNSFTERELTVIFNSFRLKYSNTAEDWSFLLNNDLLYADYRGLKLGGIVFVGTKSAPLNRMIIPQDRIKDITRVFDKSRFKTDKGITHPYTNFKFIHVEYLKKNYILDKLEKYSQLTKEDELLEALKEEYNELFKSE